LDKKTATDGIDWENQSIVAEEMQEIKKVSCLSSTAFSVYPVTGIISDSKRFHYLQVLPR